ncbi:hypothetical protein F5X99DRAFT_57431 [Biscogniauxia marginata]|nr:hypothetical protein F5X99DRAFT_57431 [Biscogniauxia marginata]
MNGYLHRTYVLLFSFQPWSLQCCCPCVKGSHLIASTQAFRASSLSRHSSYPSLGQMPRNTTKFPYWGIIRCRAGNGLCNTDRVVYKGKDNDL